MDKIGADRKHRISADNRANVNLAKSKAIYKDDKRQAKYEYKSNIEKTKAAYKNNYKKLKSEDSAADVLLFNKATRKRAAKYMTEHNMSMSEARKKAHGDAVRNTATLLGIVGGVTLVHLASEKFK